MRSCLRVDDLKDQGNESRIEKEAEDTCVVLPPKFLNDNDLGVEPQSKENACGDKS